MNIFATSPSPIQSAHWLDDKRVNKMVLETAQLLSAAVIMRGGNSRYALTHYNHPCGVWARKTSSNFKWLYQHGIALADVYKLAYGRSHACIPIIEECYRQVNLIPKGILSEFANATPYKNSTLDIHSIYRKYMTDKWNEDAHPTWKGRDKPTWYKQEK